MVYYSIDAIKQKMARYCAYQERSHYQVEKKLREMDMIPEAIDAIMLFLIQEGFLNEERFARAYVRGKFYQNGWGKQKIIQGLKQHQIHPNLITTALTEINQTDYQQTIKNLIEKKTKSLPDNKSYQTKQKIVRYLVQKGFRYDEFGNILLDFFS